MVTILIAADLQNQNLVMITEVEEFVRNFSEQVNEYCQENSGPGLAIILCLPSLSLVVRATTVISRTAFPLHFVLAQVLIRNTKPSLQPNQLFRNNLNISSGLVRSHQNLYQKM